MSNIEWRSERHLFATIKQNHLSLAKVPAGFTRVLTIIDKRDKFNLIGAAFNAVNNGNLPYNKAHINIFKLPWLFADKGRFA